ncbi:type II secretion system F family protein [uncultured Microbacterium sp.]|uniref:Flp pilus assembly protein TadB n=1 Tax=uncultured Microbacterium sp. TaxID=191216 RepID=A0A1Y5P803_9MICO|nr:type II secretion system F family protein [uncultured Microbacterium sp.]SBS74836.1 Flp pilus assembly protein TadB [uncultured Microbacterium sp.]
MTAVVRRRPARTAPGGGEPADGVRRRGGRGARTDAAGDGVAAVAETMHRLAVLLQAGVAPARAWEHLADTGDDGARRVCAAGERGTAPADAVAALGGAWRQVAVAWQVALTVGAPLAQSLRGLADALREAQDSRDDVAVALAEPAATARLIAWLPLVAVGMAFLLGFDVVAIATNPIGIACLALGVTLMVVAHRWSSRLVARAQPDPSIAGLDAEVVAIALFGGVSIDRALRVVEESGGGGPTAATSLVLALSQSAGAPAVELLRAAAAAERHRVRTDGRLRAARLGSRLLLPLGVCTLPAFLLLGVAPMLLSVLSATPLTL